MLRERFGESIAQILWPIQESGDVFVILVCACLVFFALFFYDHQRRTSLLSTCCAMVVGIWIMVLVRDGNVPVPKYIQTLFPSIFGEKEQDEYEGEDEAEDYDDGSSYAANADDSLEPFEAGANSELLKQEEASAGLGDLSTSYSGASLPPNFTVVWPNGNTCTTFRSSDVASGTAPNGDDLSDGTLHINSATLQETMKFAMGSENCGIEFFGGVDEGFGTDDSWGTGRNKARLDQLFRYMATMDARDNAQGATPQRQKLQRKLLQRSAGAAAAAAGGSGGVEVEVAAGCGGTVDGHTRIGGSHPGTAAAAAEAEDVLQDSGKMEALLRELGEHGATPKACGPSKRAKPKRSSAPRGSRGGGGGSGITPLKEAPKQQPATALAAAVAEVPAESEEDALKAAEDFSGFDSSDFGNRADFGSAQLGEGFQVVANRKARRKGRQRSSTSEAGEGLEAVSELHGRDSSATVEAAPVAITSVALQSAKPRTSGTRGPCANATATLGVGATATAVNSVRGNAAGTPTGKSKPTRAPWATQEVPARASTESQAMHATPADVGSELPSPGGKPISSGNNTSEAIREAETSDAGEVKAKVAECSPPESQHEAEDPSKNIPSRQQEGDPATQNEDDEEMSAEQAAQGEDGDWDDDEDWEWQCPSGYRLEQYICPRPTVCSSCGETQPEGSSMLRSEASAWAACEECLNLAWEQPVATDMAEETLDPSRMSSAEIAAWFKQYGAEDALRECMKQVLAQAGQQRGTPTEAEGAE